MTLRVRFCGALWPSLIATFAACSTAVEPHGAPIVATLHSTTSSLATGDSAIFSLVVRNTSSARVTYETGTCPDGFDVTVYTAAGAPLWRRSDLTCGGVARRESIAPHDSLQFSWTMRVGQPLNPTLAAGRYRITGTYIDSRREVIVTASPSLEIEVR